MAISELCDELLHGTAAAGPFLDQPSKREWYAFSLAIACVEVGEIERFISLYDHVLMDNPLFCQIGLTGIELLKEKGYYPTESPENLEHLRKRLGRKVQRNKKLLSQLETTRPLLLANPLADKSQG